MRIVLGFLLIAAGVSLMVIMDPDTDPIGWAGLGAASLGLFLLGGIRWMLAPFIITVKVLEYVFREFVN